MKNLNIGMIGYGFMGRAHSNAFHQVKMFFKPNIKPVLKVACGRDKAKVEALAQRWGWEESETDWRKVVERKDVDVIDICSPNNTHCEIALAAASSGKAVLCEKPLAMNTREAEQMVDAVYKAGVANMVWFNYRRVPAISLAKQIIDEGRLGRIFHYRATYLQDWTINPEIPLIWRLNKAIAGSGVTGDLISHLVDTARFLIGEFESVMGLTKIFIHERPPEKPGKGVAKKKVEIEDTSLFLATFKNEAVGTFEATRYARGRKNKNFFEVNGERGTIAFDLEDMSHLQFFDYGDPTHLQGFRNILVTASEHPYMDKFWVPGCSIGYEHTFINAAGDLLNSLETGKPVKPDFADGVACQRILDAVLASAEKRSWVNV